MKGKIMSIAVFIIFIFVLTSGLFEKITNFLIWLVTLNMTQSSVSIAGEIFVKIASWIISYIVVGFLFKTLGWFNSDVMKFVYFIVSALVSFALCYVVMLLETYLLYIAITCGILLIVIIGIAVFLHIKHRKNGD